MTASTIDKLLSDLGEAFNAQIKAANDDKIAARAELAEIKNGLRLIVGGTEPNDHSNTDAAETREPLNSASAVGSQRLNKSLPEDALLAALSTDWATAVQVRQTLLGAGFKIAEGTVYNRMRKLAASYPDLVETAVKPERWRKKSHNEDHSSNPEHSPSEKKQKKATQALLSQESAEGAANDNLGPIHLPTLYRGDCLEVMKSIPDASVDLILVDLPYGTTGLKIDQPIDLRALWIEYRRIIKHRGNIVLFGAQPFTTKLINAAPDLFKYPMVWDKHYATGHQHAWNRPLKAHEDVLLFSPGTNISASRSKRRATYIPQGADVVRKKNGPRVPVKYLANSLSGGKRDEYDALRNCPTTILSFPKKRAQKGLKAHPFAKPLDLLEYLIKTYSNCGETVLDNTMGSGSTGVAALRTGRRFIGIEQDENWFAAAEKRIMDEAQTLGVETGADPATAATSLPVAAGTLPALVPTCVSPAPCAVKVPDGVILPSYQSEDMKLFKGDCLEVMKTMPGGSVDLVFTSPPYNLRSSSGGLKNTKNSLWKNAALANGYASYDDARDPAEYIEWQKDVLRECWRLLSPEGAIFYQHKPRGQNKVLQTPLDLNPGLPVRQILIWNRNSGFNFNSSYFLSTQEWIVIFAKPDFKLTDAGKRVKDIWNIQAERNNPHPAPFPVELPQTAIEATSAKVILDPFAGSGTTGVAALRCGREFIGIELDAGYLSGAKERIEAERLRLVA